MPRRWFSPESHLYPKEERTKEDEAALNGAEWISQQPLANDI